MFKGGMTFDEKCYEHALWRSFKNAHPERAAKQMLHCARNAARADRSNPFTLARALTHLKSGCATPQDFQQFERGGMFK